MSDVDPSDETAGYPGDRLPKPTAISELLEELEAKVHELGQDAELEKMLSVNEWIDRIKGAAQAAHAMARADRAVEEERAWLDMAAIAVRRILTIREHTR